MEEESVSPAHISEDQGEVYARSAVMSSKELRSVSENVSDTYGTMYVPTYVVLCLVSQARSLISFAFYSTALLAEDVFRINFVKTTILSPSGQSEREQSRAGLVSGRSVGGGGVAHSTCVAGSSGTSGCQVA